MKFAFLLNCGHIKYNIHQKYIRGCSMNHRLRQFSSILRIIFQINSSDNYQSVFHEMHIAPAKAKCDRQMDRQTMDKMISTWHFALLVSQKLIYFAKLTNNTNCL